MRAARLRQHLQLLSNRAIVSALRYRAMSSAPPFTDAPAHKITSPPNPDWAFGQPITAIKLDLGHPTMTDEDLANNELEASRALPASAMERFLHRGEDDDEIVVTTRRRRGAGRLGDPDEDGFFEDDCEVLDFADQRV